METKYSMNIFLFLQYTNISEQKQWLLDDLSWLFIINKSDYFYEKNYIQFIMIIYRK